MHSYQFSPLISEILELVRRAVYTLQNFFVYYLLMNLKQLNVKQAERWLEKLKNENLQSYKDITKFLRKYEKTEDEYDCYIKISHTLLFHSELTKQLNAYMEEGNKFVVNKPEDEKIKDFMGYVKKNRAEVFDEIIRLIQDLSKFKGQNPLEISKNLKPRLRDITRGDPELERITEQALDLSGQELINRKNLEHLKMPKTVNIMPEEPQPRPQPKEPTARAPPKVNDTIKTTQKPTSRPPLTTFTNPSQQRAFMRTLQKQTDEATYNYIIKIIKVYYLNIITRNQAFDLLSNTQVEDLYMECVKDIIDSRETQRRKLSVFRPLNDMNFSNSQRASPSYVSIPIYYPIICSGKTDMIKALTNDKWVSVPYGSQESQNFSVRNKNSNQINLLKAEDQRYEFDIYMKRLEKTYFLLEKLLDQKYLKCEQEKQSLLNKIISMGVLQLIYKNCHRDQKEQFQWFLKANETETLKLFKQKISLQINQLKGIKQIHANKNWSEVASKNFFKALDLKGFEFKKNEKQKMKGTFFISELQERSKILENGGQSKNNMITFQDKKQFFTILNSFESSSRTQKCTSRVLPSVEAFDLKDQQRRHFYPLMIIALQEQPICQQIYSLLLFYIESSQSTEAQKIRCKYFLEQFLVGFLGWKLPIKRCLSQNFDEQKLYNKIANFSQEQIDLNSWIAQQQQISLLCSVQKSQVQGKTMGFLNDKVSEYSYLPAKSNEKIILYGSQHLYTFSRFIYAVYERLIKMREVSQSNEKNLLFEILFYACIKVKQGMRFEQNLNLLFGKHAYLFSTVYKLFDNLLKSLSNASICPLINYSFKYVQQYSQDIYFVLLNRFCLANNLTNNKILRLTYNKQNKVIYFNYLQSYYKSDQIGKDITKKRVDIAKGIQIYTVDSFGLVDKKRRKPNDILENNELEYIFDGNTIKMLNHAQNQDLLCYGGKKTNFSKTIKREIKRAHKLVVKTS